RQIEVVPLVEEDSGDSAGDLDPTIEKTPGVYCPRTGGADELPKIVQSLAEKVTYRWGGKGGSPPYPEKKSGPYAAFANFCPPGMLCLDCSGFVNFVRSCAGFQKISGNTTDMFQNAEKIDKIDMQNKTVNGIALQPGDLFGYTANESKSGAGHVIMYVGRGRTVQSRGGKTGRQPGANPVFSLIPSDNKTYKHILRVQAP
ncbi:MAG: NlpC/P60 family protein, partial [Candidatus Uhrbacteria bacterium]|nr:NlpC/P60 family protein [Candidatus Uhrbacteria bacterium]